MNSVEKRAILGVGGIFALRMIGLFMIVPVFSVYGDNYAHATPFLIGLAVGIYGLGQAIFQIPMSLAADKFPRKPIIFLGLILFALGGIIAANATDIYEVIIGRALAGSGAVSAVLMALLADVTREEMRTKAMATMGLTIATSIMLAFAFGPLLVGSLGISGLFWLTAGFAVLAMLLLLFVPTPLRVLKHNLDNKSIGQQLATVLKIGDLNRLHIGIFALHLTMTAIFVILPHQLNEVLGLSVRQQGLVYLPLLFIGFAVAIPFIIIAEKKRKMRQVFLGAIALMTVALALLALGGQVGVGIILGLLLYFMGFNLLEATIPSWISKRAPVANKATAMGLNSSSQFFGAFVGGAMGGLLLSQPNLLAWGILAIIMAASLLLIIPIADPPYLSSTTVTIPKNIDIQDWSRQMLAVDGVDELVVMAKEQVAYLKLDKTQLTDTSRQELSHLAQSPLDI
ncbi:putative sugar efflux transporter, Major facilitator superfamily (MFS) [Psychrobacter arcticus 273-4]|uniref:Putative sugar efflux transporter, Major facilitator superfamily (MFS) n=1 Tax=Psychrobacter arcticus (strain DSM 17307 / VKM B-2377 / 273-4) TaxID=259536 RepID=Q4FR26_PSYA2|nr:MFS transporter [Psychrobacter arcticus]AAZ19532.1 putative sugar efflux transporter, Major facilitator superfamily (MFS) [Psychrobacter arcticus 273-4]